MKKNVLILMAGVMMLAGCGTYAGEGAGTGAYFGSIVGSCIGGISGGPRGSDIGTLVGMAGGAIVGAAVGNAQDEAQKQDMVKYREEKARLAANREARRNAGIRTQEYSQNSTYGSPAQGFSFEQEAMQDSGFDSTNSADDIIDLDLGNDDRGDYGMVTDEAVAAPQIEIRNARFFDANGDNRIGRGETCRIVFEIFNSGSSTAYNLQPTVFETTGNKHIIVSPSITIENLGAGQGVRYTANIVADRSLKNGAVQFTAAVAQGGTTVSKVVSFTVETGK